MAEPARHTPFTHLLAPAAVVSCVLLMIVPLPPLMLDLLLSIDIGLAVVLLLTSLYVKDAVQFSVFPSLLLVLTLLRLSLNVASTRLVLLHGAEGVEAAGNVIMSFGLFVVGGALGGFLGTRLAKHLAGYKHALTLTFSGIVIAVGLYVIAKSAIG